LEKNLFFVGILSATDEESRIRIRMSVVRILGSGSVPKCHGSTTLVLRQHSILLHQELPRKPDLTTESGTVITCCMIVTSEDQQGTNLKIEKTLKFGTYGIFYFKEQAMPFVERSSSTDPRRLCYHKTPTHDPNQ
jgi:hypothetical protein